MALCGTTRSQLSRQFHCRYVFRARHSKILGVQVARNYALDQRDTFLPGGLERGLQDGHADTFGNPSWTLRPLLQAFWTARRGRSLNEVEIGSDKSSANCIRAARCSRSRTAQVRRLPTYRSVTKGESLWGTIDGRRAKTNTPSLRGLYQVYKTLVRLLARSEHVGNFDHSLTGRGKGGGPFPVARCRLGVLALITLSQLGLGTPGNGRQIPRRRVDQLLADFSRWRRRHDIAAAAASDH